MKSATRGRRCIRGFQPGSKAAARNGANKRKRRTLDQLIANKLNQKVVVKKADGSRTRMTNAELIAANLVNMARSSDPKQAIIAYRILKGTSPTLEDDLLRHNLKVEIVDP